MDPNHIRFYSRVRRWLRVVGRSARQRAVGAVVPPPRECEKPMMVSRQDRNQIANVLELPGTAHPMEELAVCRIALSEAHAYQAATSEILEVIGRSPSDAQPVFDTIVERAVRLCEAAFGFVLRFDGKIVSIAAYYNLEQEGLVALQQVWPMAPNPQSLAGRAILERRVVHVRDILAETGYPYSDLQRTLGYRTIVVVPMFRQEEAIGAIAIHRKEVAPFTQRQIALVQTFASQAAIAIENTRLFAEIQDKTREVEKQSAELAEWNRTLEIRVAEQVAQLGRMSKLTRFLSPRISDLIMSGEADDPLKTRRSEVTVVYVDLRGFTAFTEMTDPEEVMSVLREYHAELGRAITAYDGTIEHFAGDGAMILFNAPLPIKDHELQAIRMALQIRDSVAKLDAGWKKRGYSLGLRAGIAGGYATIGTIGFEERLDYVAIGMLCNLSTRLCGEASDGQILISRRVFAKVEQYVEAVAVGELRLNGFHRPVAVQNVLALRDAGME